MKWRSLLETLVITLGALAVSLVVFGLFMYWKEQVTPDKLFYEMYRGAFGTKFSWQNTLTRAAPLILTALCTAIPARLGLIVIGAEGALVLGGLAAASVGLLLQGTSALSAQVAMALAGMLAGGLLIAFVGLLRERRGVNETIASLLLTYIAIAIFNFLVEGPLRDPASLNKPSTYPIQTDYMLGKLFGMDIHVGLAFGVIFCVVSWVLLEHTTFGFAARMVGGNIRAAKASGLPVARLIFISCLLAGSAAGLAGMVEVAAVHRQANASLIAGYGFTGILVSFIARHNPLAIIPAAILFGGLSASSGLLQRSLKLPDASVQVLMGIIFVMILLFETLYGRIRFFQPRMMDITGTEENSPPVQQAAKEVVLQ